MSSSMHGWPSSVPSPYPAGPLQQQSHLQQPFVSANQTTSPNGTNVGSTLSPASSEPWAAAGAAAPAASAGPVDNYVTLYMLMQQGLISKQQFDSLTQPAPAPPPSSQPAADLSYSNFSSVASSPMPMPAPAPAIPHHLPSALSPSLLSTSAAHSPYGSPGAGPSSGAFTHLAARLASSLPRSFATPSYGHGSPSLPPGAIQAALNHRRAGESPLASPGVSSSFASSQTLMSPPSSSSFHLPPPPPSAPPSQIMSPASSALQDERLSAELLAIQLSNVLDNSIAASASSHPSTVSSTSPSAGGFSFADLFPSTASNDTNTAATSASPEDPAEERDKLDDLPHEEERGRRRTTGSGGSHSASPEGPVEPEDDFMDWRAKSKSRSRSRAGHDSAMDWRAPSRSRSRAPEFRVPLAVPPTLSPAVATGRFTGESATGIMSSGIGAGTSMSTNNSTSGSSASARTSDLFFTPQQHTSLHQQLQQQEQQHSHFPQQHQALSQHLPHVQQSPHSLQSPSFAFPPTPHDIASPSTTPANGNDPNLAAIENTLNQLISLQLLAAASPPPPSSGFVSVAGSPAAGPSPEGEAPGASSAGTATPATKNVATASNQSLAQQALQQLAAGRKLGHQATTSTSYPRPPPSTSSPYLNAANLASASRPFSFASAASGLSLQRPSQISMPDQPFSPAAAAASSFSLPSTPLPNLYSSSAPAHTFFNSPLDLSSTSFLNAASPMPFSPESVPQTPVGDPFAFDYSSYSTAPSPYASFYPIAPTHVNPSQLINNLQTSLPYESSSDATSPWGFSPLSGNESSRTGTPSPPDAPGSGNPNLVGSLPTPSPITNSSKAAGRPLPTALAASLKKSASLSSSKKSSAGSDKPLAVQRTASTPDLASIKTKGKSASAPGTRVHSRSNTLTGSMGPPPSASTSTSPSTAVGASAAASTSTAPSSTTSKDSPSSGDTPGTTPKSDGAPTPAVDSGEVRCLNCSTTNTPLWRRDNDGRPLCNACGLFRNLHGVDRPANLNTGVIKKRNRARGGPKDSGTKKSASRNASRRNSLGASPPAPKARTNSTPYPSSAARAEAAGKDARAEAATLGSSAAGGAE